MTGEESSSGPAGGHRNASVQPGGVPDHELSEEDEEATRLDRESEDSFPSSDPPSSTAPGGG
jgi:hypothetical protein